MRSLFLTGQLKETNVEGAKINTPPKPTTLNSCTVIDFETIHHFSINLPLTVWVIYQ
jgi:hypothetical protein